jgi:hypothetical protein
VCTLPPQELPELQKSDLLHLYAAVGLNAPQEIGAAPRGEPMASGGIPHESQGAVHG